MFWRSKRLKKLRTLTAAVQRQLNAIGLGSAETRTFRDIIGESYAQELEKLSDVAAVKYLKTVDDSKLVEAYLFLSMRLSPSLLAEVCLDYLGRTTFAPRLMGVQIGIFLFGTHHKEASRLLAQLILDAREQSQLRRNAYTALEQINADEEIVDYVSKSVEAETNERRPPLEGIDWKFVESFL